MVILNCHKLRTGGLAYMFNRQKEKMHFFEEQIIHTEDRFINAYMSEHPDKIKALRLLFKLYKGHYGRLLLGALIYIIKDSPMWVLPLITANVINLVTNPPENFWTQIIINAIIAVSLLLLNIPFHTLYVKILSKANRNVEAGLRGAMVRKLQQLSISYHKDTQSGKIQSKVMRDVEVVTMHNPCGNNYKQHCNLFYVFVAYSRGCNTSKEFSQNYAHPNQRIPSRA